ncbi:hypothetical protein E2562_031406 [Oryza meyeriana var. granulata]|uniref:Uncharacterized protein n=1 Tax=Oryza meyeriana var. granulata TaxID=110450 RepID=A0A6G1C0T9_9ORYZ|nr:hypothetical protein E2562_031406 [Oryza meyeriana var. granulata]
MTNVKYPHTAIAIEEAITKCLTEWSIRDKTCAVLNEVDKLVAIVKIKTKHNHEIMRSCTDQINRITVHLFDLASEHLSNLAFLEDA